MDICCNIGNSKLHASQEWLFQDPKVSTSDRSLKLCLWKVYTKGIKIKGGNSGDHNATQFLLLLLRVCIITTFMIILSFGLCKTFITWSLIKRKVHIF